MHHKNNKKPLHTVLRTAIIITIIALLVFLSYFIVVVSQLDKDVSVFDYFFAKKADKSIVTSNPDVTASQTITNKTLQNTSESSDMVYTNDPYDTSQLPKSSKRNNNDNDDSPEDNTDSTSEQQTDTQQNNTTTQNNNPPAGSDSDGDGYTTPSDCDDLDPYINPGHSEDQYNNLDDDCNQETPDAPSFWLGKILVAEHPQPGSAETVRAFLGNVQYRISTYTAADGTLRIQTMLPQSSAGSRLKIVVGSAAYQITVNSQFYQRVSGPLETWQN